MKRFKQVAVLKGGWGSEREVSLRSGAAVARGLREAGYAVEEIDVVSEALALPASVEAVFIALHGAFGEDGGVQAWLDARGLPYTGSGAASCRLAFDKHRTRDCLAAAGLPVAPGVVLTAPADAPPLPLPLVVKPCREGSSVGCHRVFEAAEWAPAVADALRFDREALVETYIPGRELTVGVLDEEPLPIVEIRPRGGYYDYQSKYTSGMTDYLVPAPLSGPDTARVQALALAVFRALGARGFGRVDVRMTPEGAPFVLELNSIPGFTETSLLPKAAAAAGIKFSALCDRILNNARAGS